MADPNSNMNTTPTAIPTLAVLESNVVDLKPNSMWRYSRKPLFGELIDSDLENKDRLTKDALAKCDFALIVENNLDNISTEMTLDEIFSDIDFAGTVVTIETIKESFSLLPTHHVSSADIISALDNYTKDLCGVKRNSLCLGTKQGRTLLSTKLYDKHFQTVPSAPNLTTLQKWSQYPLKGVSLLSVGGAACLLGSDQD
eukprot:scaffold16412_cov171-Amphora_coffeaeformis.AAC.1